MRSIVCCAVYVWDKRYWKTVSHFPLEGQDFLSFPNQTSAIIADLLLTFVCLILFILIF